MLASIITDARAWRSTIDDPGPGATACPSAVWPGSTRPSGASAASRARQRRSTRRGGSMPAASRKWRRSARRLEDGRGFAIVHGLPSYSADEMQAAYWLVGQLLGRPVEQNVQGTLLYDVRNEGQSVQYGARFSVTNAETGYHTDNSFGETIIDYVGLLCLQTAHEGGLNQVVSGYTLHNELLARHPDVLATLYEPFHFDRRGGVKPGDAPTVVYPILRWAGRGLECRYLRYWIDAGHAKAGQPLTAAQQRALDVLDAVAREPHLHVEFGLQPGDMLFANNRWLLHNRSAFADHAEPERRRHLVRLWLASAAA